MGEEWTYTYDKIEDAYIPGDTLPPVKNEWRFRYYSYFWKVAIKRMEGDKQKRYAPFRSTRRPVINGSVIGIAIDNDGENPRWLFVEFSECEISKFRVRTNYILLSDDDDGVKVKFRDDDPISIPDNDGW